MPNYQSESSETNVAFILLVLLFAAEVTLALIIIGAILGSLL